jgi:thiamine biosynthesis lipoprotein
VNGFVTGVVMAAAVTAGAAASAAPGIVERTVYLMGTAASVRVEAGDRAAALAASEAAVRALEAAEARLSTWTEESELARLNRAPVGEPTALSPALAAELAAADACRRDTGGAFDPAVGTLVEAWGLRSGGRLPNPGELAAARAATGGEGLELRAGGAAVRRWPGLSIEEGGFGKGAALDAALAAAATASPEGLRAAWIDLGGQVAYLGRSSEPVEVTVAHPVHRDRQLVALRLDGWGDGHGGSVATSGNSERGITVAGERRSHVLDPRTGEPAPDFGSLTVLAPTGLRADCLSTGLYALGPEAALAWAAAHPGVEVVVLRHGETGVEVLATPGLQGRLRVLDPAAVTSVRFEESQPPVQVTGNEESRGAGASEASEAGSARRSPADRGRRVSTRRPHDPQESIYVPFS